MSISGIFIASIILACIRADMIHIDLTNHLMNSTENAPIAADMNESVSTAVVESQNEATEGLGIEGILETLGNVFRDETTTTEEYHESTTTGDGVRTETTIQMNGNKMKSTGAQDSESESEDTTSADADTTAPDSADDTTTSTHTTTIDTTPKQNSCELLLPDPLFPDDPCTIACYDVPSSDLSNEIRDALQASSNLMECSADLFDLSLKSIYFSDGSIERHFLQELQVSIRYLTITNSAVTQIAENAFNTVVFSNLLKLVLEVPSDFYLFNSESFRGLSKLETLQMSNLSKLETVSSLVLRPLAGSLVNLIINRVSSSWNIEKLLINASLSKIQTVNFQSNNFEDLTFNASTFSGVCGSITTLRLALCRLKTLTVDAFGYCPYLTLLELRNNNLETLPKGIFDKLPKLASLLLQSNKFKSIPHGLFATVLSLPNITSINLTQNLWRCDLDIVYLKQILTTHGDVVTAVECDSPKAFNGTNIRDLWCTFDSCTIYCDGMYSGDLSGALAAYNEVDCESMKLKLIHLNLTGNSIDSYWLSALEFNIRSLVIARTYIESIQNDTFNSAFFRNLSELIIDSNTANTFLISLNGLNGLASLERLKIKNSAIVSVIAANQNLLEPVSATLTDLCISSIRSQVPSFVDLFRSVTLARLKSLKLYGNNFSSLNITTSSFWGAQRSVEELFLNSSQISTIASNALSEYENLKLLHLENNQLKKLSPDFFGDYASDVEFLVFLSGNPWQCDSDLCHLMDILQDQESVICNSTEGSEMLVVLEEICLTTTVGLTSSNTDHYDNGTTTSEITTTVEVTSPTTSPTIPTTTTSTQSTTTSTTPTVTTTSTSTTSTDPSTDSVTETETTTVEITTDSTTLAADNTTTTTTSTATDTTSSTSKSSSTSAQSTTVGYSGSTTRTTTTTEPCMPLTTVPPTTPDFQSSTNPSDGMLVQCFDTGVNTSSLNINRLLSNLNLIKALSTRDPINIFRPVVSFNLSGLADREEVTVEFTNGYDDNMVMVFYPSMEDPFVNENGSDPRHSVRCISINRPIIVIPNIAPDTIYNFCALYRDANRMMFTPFQCKSYVITQGHHQPWLYEEHKAVIITSLTLLLLLALVIGIILTYFLIRQMPTLIKGSKRVVMVNNRTKEVMILPRSNSESRSNSCRKESITPITAEPPTYLTPLPRQSIDNRPPFVRSNSDTSLKSYVSVSRLPPRFSQVFQRSDFDCESPRRCGSYSHCHPSAPCQQHSPELPPPLPRRSVVSTASSTLHSCASTAEIGKPLSRASANNSTYRRQPRPIEIEQENHYNFII